MSIEESTPEVVETPVDVVEEQVVDTPEVTEEVSEEVTEPTEEPTEEVSEESEEVSEESVEPELTIVDLKYGDMDISANIPAEVDSMLSEKGFSAQELTKEIYADGEISLSQETLDKLYVEFGQFQVDSYMDGLKNHAELMRYTQADASAKHEAATTEAWNSALEVVGSDENWASMEAWLQSPESLDSVSDEQIAQFNEVMENGSSYTKGLALNSLYSQFTATLPEDAPELQLLDGDSSSKSGEKSYLTQDEYFQLQVSGEYANATQQDQNKWDSQRQKGITKGF